MSRNTRRKGIKRYTVLVPKTVKATTNLGKNAIKGINSFFVRLTNKVQSAKNTIDKKTAKMIRSITKKRGKKRN